MSNRQKGSGYWSKGWRKVLWVVLTAIYLLLVVSAVYYGFAVHFKLSEKPVLTRFTYLGIGIVMSVAPTFYWWWASLDFEDWIRKRSCDPQIDAEYEKRVFEANHKHATAFWAVIVTTFAAILLKAN